MGNANKIQKGINGDFWDQINDRLKKLDKNTLNIIAKYINVNILLELISMNYLKIKYYKSNKFYEMLFYEYMTTLSKKEWEKNFGRCAYYKDILIQMSDALRWRSVTEIKQYINSSWCNQYNKMNQNIDMFIFPINVLREEEQKRNRERNEIARQKRLAAIALEKAQIEYDRLYNPVAYKKRLDIEKEKQRRVNASNTNGQSNTRSYSSGGDSFIPANACWDNCCD